jgi:hypothetical protein
MAKSDKVVQGLKGRSLRSFRLTATHRKLNRYAVYSDRKLNEVGIRDLNDVRSFIYNFSIISQDINSFVPGSFMSKLNSQSLKLGRLLGDYNAIKNSVLGLADDREVANIGERVVRRVGGKVTGRVMRAIPGGNDVFSRAAFRGIRSAVGSNVTIEMDRFIKNMRPNSVSTQMIADLSTLHMVGEEASRYLGEYAMTKLQEKTPVKSGALMQSINMRKVRSNSKKDLGEYYVGIGAVKDMPDPRVPYPWIVEFGINEGYNKKTKYMDTVLPIPKRFHFLQSVSGPVPNNEYITDYSQDNRGPFDRSKRNQGTGAMMRRTIFGILRDAKSFPHIMSAGVGKYRTNPFKEIVWQKGQNAGSMRSWDLPF